MKRTQMAIVVHTEEEFDWQAGFNSNNTQVNHAEALEAMAIEMLELGYCISFAVDYAFISDPKASNMLRRLMQNYPDKIEIGAHLHPWVNPPFDEQTKGSEIPEYLSYPGNLPYELEHEKLRLLTNKIEQTLALRPRLYLAGRYGVGENTYKILTDLGYRVDVSITPFTDYRHQSGPDFSSFDNQTIAREGITCIPHSAGYVSYSKQLTDWLNQSVDHLPRLNNSLWGKILLRLAGVKRVRLSPEGFTAKDMLKLSQSLTRIGLTQQIYSFHSSSSLSGGSPYSATVEKADYLKNNNLQLLRQLKTQCEPSLLGSIVDE